MLGNGADESPESEESPDRYSSLRVEVTLSVGYQRRRSVLGGAFEGHIVTVLLLLIGGLVVVLFVVYVFRLLSVTM